MLVIAVHVFGSLNNLFYGLANIIIERDWVVVIAQEDDAWLRVMTSRLKSIDLSCDLVAPMLVSFLTVFSYGALAATIWCVVAPCFGPSQPHSSDKEPMDPPIQPSPPPKKK